MVSAEKLIEEPGYTRHAVASPRKQSEQVIVNAVHDGVGCVLDVSDVISAMKEVPGCDPGAFTRAEASAMY